MSPALRTRTPAAVLNRGLVLLSVAHGLVLAAAVPAAPLLGLDGPWFAGAAAAMALNLCLLWLFRARMLAGDNLHAVWGVANVLTATRGVLGALLAGFLVSEAGRASWAPAVLYTVLVCLDYLDGWWARATRTQTRMGAILDQEYDAFGILVAVLLAIRSGALPPVFVVVGAARYLFVLGLALRRRRGQPVHPLPPSTLRRRLAGFQMGILAALLCPLARPPLTTLVQIIIGVPLLAGFLRDWLLAAGALSAADPRYLALKALLHRLSRRAVVPLARVALAAVAGLVLCELAGFPAPAAARLTWPEAVSRTWQPVRLALLAILAGGGLPSSASLALLLLEGARVSLARFDPQAAAAIAAALLLYLFGATRPAAAGARRRPAGRPWRALLWLPVAPLLYWALKDLRLQDLGAVLGRLRPGQLAALLSLNLVFFSVLTARWWLVLRGLGERLPFAAAAVCRLAGFTVSYLTPGPQTGGEPVQVYLASRRPGVSVAGASASVLLDKSYELLGNFFFLALGAATLAGLQIVPAGRAAALLLLPLALILPPALYLAALLRGRRPISAALVAALRPRPRLRRARAARRLLALAGRGERLLVRYATVRSRILGQLALFFLLVWGLSVLEMALALRFLGIRLDLWRTVFVLTAGRLAFLLPLPAALGALELTQVGAFALLGYGPEAALGLVLYVRARDLLFAAAGALVILARRRRDPRAPRLRPPRQPPRRWPLSDPRG